MYRPTGSPPLVSRLEGNDTKKQCPDYNEELLNSSENRTEIPLSTQVDYHTWTDGSNGISHANPAFVCDIEDSEKKASTKTALAKAINENSQEADEKSDNDCLSLIFRKFRRRFQHHKKTIKRLFKMLLFLLYNVYLGFAIHKTWRSNTSWCNGPRFLVLITVLTYVIVLHSKVLKPYIYCKLAICLEPVTKHLKKVSTLKYFEILAWLVVWGCVVLFLVLDTKGDRYRLVSAAGLLILVFLGYVCSKHRRKVRWRPLLFGVLIQFLLGLVLLRWPAGRDAFVCFGDKVTAFLGVTDKGSTFVFGYLVSGKMEGEKIPDQPAIFAFKVLSVVIFFSFVVSLLYHLGVMQVLVSRLGQLLRFTLGTTACESASAAANVFLGMTEAPLLIKPYLPLLTTSELHAVMTGGFATIAGSVLAAYINFGISATHLLSASVMNAPAALAFSKLVYPETEDSQTELNNIKMDKGSEGSALEAACNGASSAVKLVSNIAANLIAFVAFIALINNLLSWFGSLLDWEEFNFEWILSKLFVPLSLLLGVDWEDKERVANLIGLKTVVNEFVAYRQLATYQEAKMLTARSSAIATYALCGFANLSSIGIQVGALGALAPSRKADVARIALSAMMCGSATCFMTACVAGTLLTH
ncbi:solute carrier family 28 member 3-like isoform X2 [Uloborus diversus]|uniref:solute carrier family 28 member 3-like isoform X2 n=1 Tax=Uloborus diversus TaxID=327109 RepID=UPI00240998A6|nr:solute carrier family 28 member 3-like isoform X2 [Uloborus diversus]